MTDRFDELEGKLVSTPNDPHVAATTSAQRLRAFRKGLVYRAEATSHEVQHDLEQIRRLDESYERRQLWWRRITWIVGLTSAAAAIIFAVPIAFEQIEKLADDVDPDLSQVFIWGFIILAIVASFVGPRLMMKRKKISWQPPPESILGWVITISIGLGAAVGACFGLSELRLREDDRANIANGALLLTAVLIFIYRWHRKRNVDNRRYELVARVLSMLERDSDPSSTLRVQLDLSVPDLASKQTESKVWQAGGRKRQLYGYTDPWLRLEGRLLDGTRYVLRWIERTKHTTSVKVHSKKTKFKRKMKQKIQVLLDLKVKPAKVPALARIGANARGAIQLAPGGQVAALQARPDGIALKVSAGPWHTGTDATSGEVHGVELVTTMFLSLFQVLGVAKTLRKRDKR